MSPQNVVSLRAREARLRRRIRGHLNRLGFSKSADGLLLPSALDKDAYRSIHAHQRAEKLAKHKNWIEANSSRLMRFFASGKDVNVRAIVPRLEAAPGGTWKSDLFRFAGLLWRIPISEGYGRRMRFLVWDDSNEKLIGVLALGDAVFNLKARDDLIGWDHHRRADALVNLMDAYVLGAVPPYNVLLGAKLIATLARTLEVVDEFNDRYGATVGLISKKKKNAHLAAITTTSALGRSSIYNRLKLDGKVLFDSIGFTAGWGHFHVPDAIFRDLRLYLEHVGDTYANASKFGQGPNWRLRVIRRSLDLLGMSPNLIRHGFPREVFFCPVASNAIPFLRGEHKRARYSDLPTVASASRAALERWVIPRAARMPQYSEWRSEQVLEEVMRPGTLDGRNSGKKQWTGRETS